MSEHKQDWLEEIVRREGVVMFSDHPSAEDLVLFIEDCDRMSPDHRLGIEDHLRVCARCADDRARIVAAARELKQSEAARRGAASFDLLRSLRGWFAPTHWIPAVVAVALTVAIMAPRSKGPLVHPVARAVVLRSEIERGAVATIAPDKDGRLTLSFVLPGTSTGNVENCDVTIKAADGLVVAAETDIGAFDSYGTFVLSLDAQGLKSGRYSLIARDDLGERHFAFDLTRSGPQTIKK